MSKGVIVWERVNSLPNNEMMDLSRFKAFANDSSNVAQMTKFVCE